MGVEKGEGVEKFEEMGEGAENGGGRGGGEALGETGSEFEEGRPSADVEGA